MDGPVSFRRVWFGAVAMTVIVVVGTVGYSLLGLGLLDALYQTVISVSTVGFREMGDFGTAEKLFTIVLVLVGVGTALYTFGVLVEALVEGHFSQLVAMRRMQRRIRSMDNHVIICGWGRVGRAIARSVDKAGVDVVVVDRDASRLGAVPYPTVNGDVTEDAVLYAAGIERARVLVAALNTDADNLYVTVSGRALRGPDLFVIARARTESSELKLSRAGADRVVNPQRIGGERMAAFAVRPHVTEFLDVVMHDERLEFHLEEFHVEPTSGLAGQTLRQTQIRDRTGALVLAVRDAAGSFATNPGPETVIKPESVLIAIGTPDQLAALAQIAAP